MNSTLKALTGLHALRMIGDKKFVKGQFQKIRASGDKKIIAACKTLSSEEQDEILNTFSSSLYGR